MEIFKAKNGILIEFNSSNTKLINNIISFTKDFPFIVGYKINTESIILCGLESIVQLIKEKTSLPLIYDHKGYGTDNLEISGEGMIEKIKKVGVDAIVILPLAGSETLKRIIKICDKFGLLAIIRGDLPDKGYFSDEGGYIGSDSQQKIYIDAASLGASYFLMSCNRLERIKIYCHQLGSIVGKLNIFLTAINSIECTNLPDACSQIKQNNVYAVFDKEFDNPTEYVNFLKTFWESFQNKLELTKK